MTPTSVTPTQIQFTVPANADSGYLTVQAFNTGLPPGDNTNVSTPRPFNIYYFTNHEDMTHFVVDLNHDAWVTERGTSATADKLYKINHTTGAIKTFTALNEAVGLPIDSAGNLYISNSINQSTNQGTIRRIDTTGALFSWGAAGSTTFPVYSYAMAIDPLNNTPASLTVYDLDGDNIDHPSQIRVVTAGSRSLYQSIGNAIPNPGGLDIDTTGHMFYTADAVTVQEMDISKLSVFSYTGADYNFSFPAQIAMEKGKKRFWVANKGIGEILRVSSDAALPPGPSRRKTQVKMSSLTSPRGIAYDADPTIDTNTGLAKNHLYVAEQTRVQRFRVYDTVWVSVHVMNQTLLSPDGLGRTELTQADMNSRITADFNVAREAWKQAGIELKLRGVDYFDDPNKNSHCGQISSSCTSNSPFPGWVALDNGPTVSTEASALFLHRSSNPKDINIYYVVAMWQLGPSAGIFASLNGITFTNDAVPGLNNDTASGIIISRYNSYTASPQTFAPRKTNSTPGHEIGHFLANNYDAGVLLGEHELPDTPFLMSRTGFDAIALTSGIINNIQTNSDESSFIDRF